MEAIVNHMYDEAGDPLMYYNMTDEDFERQHTEDIRAKRAA